MEQTSCGGKSGGRGGRKRRSKGRGEVVEGREGEWKGGGREEVEGRVGKWKGRREGERRGESYPFHWHHNLRVPRHAHQCPSTTFRRRPGLHW